MADPATAVESLNQIRKEIAEARGEQPTGQQRPEVGGEKIAGRILAQLVEMPNGNITLQLGKNDKQDIERALTVILDGLKREITMELMEERIQLAVERLAPGKQGRIWTPGEAR